MVKVNKVGHVVLNVRDVEASAKFYSEALGMEIMSINREHPMAFLSFGTQHHDIALFKAPEGAEQSKLGLNHIAMQIEGGEAELEAIYQKLVAYGASMGSRAEHGETKSVYFSDPDGNGLEVFSETMSPEEGLAAMRARGGGSRPMASQTAATS